MSILDGVLFYFSCTERAGTIGCKKSSHATCCKNNGNVHNISFGLIFLTRDCPFI